MQLDFDPFPVESSTGGTKVHNISVGHIGCQDDAKPPPPYVRVGAPYFPLEATEGRLW